MSRFLITQSLLSTWAYTFNCYEDGTEEALASFVQTLKREKAEPTPAMLDGIAFENEVYAAAAGDTRAPHPKWERGIQKIAPIIRGAQIQVKASRNINVAGMDFIVYGIIDALKAGVIYDVKYKTKSFGCLDLAGDYLNSAQHPAYFYIEPGAYKFQYLVSDGEDLYIEQYFREETQPISGIIAEFIASTASMGLLDLYKEKWVAL